MGARMLLERLPELEGKLAWVELGDFPTPVHEASRLGPELGVSLWLKRDDASSRLYGGNKTRKLELLLGKARQERYGGVVTTGAYGSHHVLATSIFSKKLGLSAAAVLCPQPVNDHVLDNLLAVHGTGAAIVPVSSWAAIPATMVLEARRRRAMLIPPGGSTPLGALAYAGAALELARQIERHECPAPERVYVALGSSGTMAGLVLGARLAPLETEIVGVRVTPFLGANELTVATLATQAAALLGGRAGRLRDWLVDPGAFRVLHDQIGAGYGHETAAASEAIRLAKSEEGLELDPTYTGKAFAGLLSDVRQRPPRGPVLFWSTLSAASLEPHLAGVSPEGLPSQLRELLGERG